MGRIEKKARLFPLSQIYQKQPQIILQRSSQQETWQRIKKFA